MGFKAEGFKDWLDDLGRNMVRGKGMVWFGEDNSVGCLLSEGGW